MTRLPEELVELIFDKLLEQYLPDLETKKTLFTRVDQQALSALTMVSLVAARRTRIHRFKCVVLVCKSKVSRFFKLLVAFLELSFASRRIGLRLLPISTITTNVKIVASEDQNCNYHNPIFCDFPNDDRMMVFILRLRNEFRLQQLSWFFDSRFELSPGFHQRFVGLLLSPGMKTLCLHNLTSYPMQLQGVYIPGPNSDRTFRFGEEDGVDPMASPTDIYPSYTKLELGGSHVSGLPLPFEISLTSGSIYRPFARVETFRAFDKLPYSVVQSVLEKNDGSLRTLRIGSILYLPSWYNDAHAVRSTRRSKPSSPIDFTHLYQLSEVRIEYFLQKCIKETPLRQIRKLILEAVLTLCDITPQLIGDSTPVRTLNLGAIPMQLSPQPPRPSEPLDTAEMDMYCDLLAQSPIPCENDVAMWSILDAALCTHRFANLETLKVDYVIFDNRANQDPPKGYEDVVEQLVAPRDWLAITKSFFPRTTLSDRIRLEGKIIAIAPLSHYDDVDYSKGVCTGRYP